MCARCVQGVLNMCARCMHASCLISLNPTHLENIAHVGSEIWRTLQNLEEICTCMRCQCNSCKSMIWFCSLYHIGAISFFRFFLRYFLRSAKNTAIFFAFFALCKMYRKYLRYFLSQLTNIGGGIIPWLVSSLASSKCKYKNKYINTNTPITRKFEFWIARMANWEFDPRLNGNLIHFKLNQRGNNFSFLGNPSSRLRRRKILGFKAGQLLFNLRSF